MVSDNELRQIFKESMSIAVIGLSPVPARPSYGVTRYMQNQGYEIYGVRPASPPQILGRPCVESLSQLEADIDIIDVFRNSDAVSGLVDEIAKWLKSPAMENKRKPKLLFLQEGVHDVDAEAKAENLGLKVISNRCILKEHARLS
jgi:predicted CoA-binding protein